MRDPEISYGRIRVNDPKTDVVLMVKGNLPTSIYSARTDERHSAFFSRFGGYGKGYGAVASYPAVGRVAKRFVKCARTLDIVDRLVQGQRAFR